MTDITERKIEYRELNRMVVVCKQCAAEVALDIANQEQFEAINNEAAEPSVSSL